jgi:hypothetical protein
MTIDLEELRQQKAFEELQKSKEETDVPPDVTTSFLVVQGLDGNWTVLHEYEDREFVPQRSATMDDIVAGCSNALMGCQIQQTALAGVILMEQRTMQMQQKMLQQQESNRLASMIDPSRLRA